MKNIKGLLITAAIAGLLFGNTFVVSAQTTTATSTTSLQALIQTLQEQIKNLTTQLESIKKAQQQVAVTGGEIKDTLKLINQLREGASGDDVKVLQAVLAADPSVYPAGLITGYYGKLTAQAVRSFQKVHGLDQVGNVGPKTLEKITKELEKNPVSVEVRNGVKTLCAIVPPGHLIAPGWLKKMNGEVPLLPTCQIVPAGIAKKIGSATSTPPTATPDTVAPIISAIEIRNITASGAKIEWDTNESATSIVWYATSTPIVTSIALVSSSATLVKDHSVTLTGLAANTVYYIMIGSADAANNTGMSAQYSFMTLSLPDTTAPVISGFTTTGTTASSTMISWNTSELATGKVWYATSTPIVTSIAPTMENATLATAHGFTVTGIASGTVYYYVVTATDAAGNTATSSEATFQTL